jgi:hypothetical protein
MILGSNLRGHKLQYYVAPCTVAGLEDTKETNNAQFLHRKDTPNLLAVHRDR